MVAALSLHSVVDFRFLPGSQKNPDRKRVIPPRELTASTQLFFFEIKSAKNIKRRPDMNIYTCP